MSASIRVRFILAAFAAIGFIRISLNYPQQAYAQGQVLIGTAIAPCPTTVAEPAQHATPEIDGTPKGTEVEPHATPELEGTEVEPHATPELEGTERPEIVGTAESVNHDPCDDNGHHNSGSDDSRGRGSSHSGPRGTDTPEDAQNRIQDDSNHGDNNNRGNNGSSNNGADDSGHHDGGHH